jgi:glycosyltransferase involved in cell wall biosynthesis
VPCNDTDAFAAAASALLDDPAERERLGAIGRERVAGALSWDQSKLHLVAAYEAAMAGSAPAPALELLDQQPVAIRS